MDRIFFENNLKSLKFQRNFLIGLSFLLSLSLILASSFLFLRNERILVVPPVVEKEFWVDSESVSASYLEQFGFFIGQLLLNKSAHSAETHRAILSRHTQPNYLTALKQKLVEEEGVLKKQNASYVFYLNNIFADPKTLKVTLVGERQFFVGGKQTSQEKRAYTLHFKYEGIRLLLNGISEEKDRSLMGEN